MERYHYFHHVNISTSKSNDRVKGFYNPTMTPWNSCVDYLPYSSFLVSDTTKNKTRKHINSKKNAGGTFADTGSTTANNNNFRFFSALRSTSLSSSACCAAKRRVLNEENINYMVKHPSSVEGKITRRALLEKIFNDPILFREFQKKLRDCKQRCHCHTNAGVVAHLNYDTKLLQDMAQHILLTTDENKRKAVLPHRQPSCPSVLEEDHIMSNNDDDDTIIYKVQHCQRFSFVSLSDEGLHLPLSKNQREQLQADRQRFSQRIGVFSNATTMLFPSDSNTAATCYNERDCAEDHAGNITKHGTSRSTNYRFPFPSRNYQQVNSQVIIDDYGWQRVMMEQKKKHEGYFVVSTNNNKKKKNKKKPIIPPHQELEHWEGNQIIEGSTNTSNNKCSMGERKQNDHNSYGDVNSPKLAATTTANGSKSDEQRRNKKSLPPVSVTVVPSKKWYITTNKPTESLDQTFVVAKAIPAAPSKARDIKSAPSA